MNTSGRDTDLPKGWPDADTLARLANEFFSAPPGEAAADTRPALDPIQLSSIPYEFGGEVPLASSVPLPVALPGEAELKAVLDGIEIASRGLASGGRSDS